MNYRERVVAAFHHQPVDRLPVDLGGMRSTGIMAMIQAGEPTENILAMFQAIQDCWGTA